MYVSRVSDKVFEDERIEVDGTTFERCKFRRCRLVFSAIDAVVFRGCVFTDCEWVFAGPAEHTLAYLSAIYRGLEPAGRELVESIFQRVREGTIRDDVVADAHELEPALSR